MLPHGTLLYSALWFSHLVCFQAQAPVVTPVQPTEPQRPTDMMISVIHTDPSLSSATDGADMMCSDLLSLKGDSLSLASSEMTSSRMVRQR